MEPNPPLTAKQAALLGAQADKPPFNPEADRRHVIASVIRRAGEAFSQADPTNDLADESQLASSGSSAANELGASDSNAAGPTYATESPTPIYSPATGDLTLAQLVRADFTAQLGFAVPMSTPHDEDESATPFFPGTPSAQSFAESPGSTAPDLPPNQPPGIGQSAERQPLASQAAPPHAENLLHRLGEPGRIELLPDSLTDRGPIDLKKVLMDDQPTADAPAPLEETPPITFLPLGGSALAADAASETARWQVELSVANVEKNSAVAYRAIEAIILKAIDRAGEQDRIDALHLAASRRACL